MRRHENGKGFLKKVTWKLSSGITVQAKEPIYARGPKEKRV